MVESRDRLAAAIGPPHVCPGEAGRGLELRLIPPAAFLLTGGFTCAGFLCGL
jgi:hypothetical protein